MKNNKYKKAIRRMVYAGICLALSFVLPFFTGNIPEIGSMLCPMHLPVLLAGFICGPLWGAAVGLLAPLLRTLVLGVPPFPGVAVPMALELLTYGLVSGFMYKILPRKKVYIWVSLITAMIAGRAAGVLTKLFLFKILNIGAPVTVSLIVANYIIGTFWGVVIQLIAVPLIIIGLNRANLIEDGSNN